MNQLTRNALANSPIAANIVVDLSVPLCEQFPMSSGILRVAVSGGLGGLMGETPEGEEAESGEDAGQDLLSSIPISGGEEFLEFEGDFNGECQDESAKIDLNYFYQLDPAKQAEGDNAYDAYKKMISLLFSQEAFRDLFEKKEVRVEEVVRNIADWVDKNDSINELGGLSSGSEGSLYPEGRPKNGKFSTLGDVFKVTGVSDEWWLAVADYFTVYGDGKVNICRARDELVKALILRYTATRQDLPPIRLDDKELLDRLVAAAKEGCQGATPDTSKIELSLNNALNELLGATTSETGKPGGSLSEWISGSSRFFTLRTAGRVEETSVTITSVIDIGEGAGTDVSKWKVLYWRVD